MGADEHGTSAGRAFGYQPALDGVRAISVVAVLLFHGGVAGFDGGYLGVSVFFTLSGFLITSLMLVEHERHHRVAIGAFYVRRAKRLLPASLLCITAIAVAAQLTDWFEGVEALRRDLLGALLQVANWVFLAGSGSYQELLARTAGQASPVEHYWSLAIEEQFYWLFPLAFVALHRLRRSHRWNTGAVAAVTLVAAVAAPAIAAVWGADAAYWATPARAAEILAGVLVAFVIHGRDVPPRWAWAVPATLAALASAVVLFPSGGGPAYEGALPLVAVASALLIVGLQAPGPARSILGAPPLAALGRISYGVYLYHWPVYVVLDEARTGWDGPALLGVRLAVTMAIAVVSYAAVERPIRAGVQWRGARTGAVALATTALGAGAVIVLVEPGPGDYWRTAAAEEAAIDAVPRDGTLPPLVADASTAVPSATGPATAGPSTTEPPTTGPSTSTAPTRAPAAPAAPATTDAADAADAAERPGTTAAASDPSPTTLAPLPPLARPMRVVVAGDSTAEATGSGLAAWAAEHPDLAQVSIVAARGCGFLRDGELDAGGWTAYESRCRTYLDEELPSTVADLRPDVVMLMTSSWDVLDRRWDGTAVLTPMDAEYRSRLVDDFGAITDRLLAAGAGRVVFVVEPVPVPLWGFGGQQAQSDPARHDVTAEVMAEVAAARPERVRLVGLASWLDAVALTEDRDARPDGVHWAPEVAQRIAEEYLGEQLLRAALGL